MAPKLEKVAEEYTGEVTTYRVKVDADDRLLGTYDVEAMPAILFFQDGDVVTRVEGLVRGAELRKAFADLTVSR